MSDQNIRDFINAAFNSKPIDATKAFDAAMHDRLGPILQAKGAEVSQRLFQGDVATEETEDEGEDPDPAGVEEGIVSRQTKRNTLTGVSTTIKKSQYGDKKVVTKTERGLGGRTLKKARTITNPNGTKTTETRYGKTTLRGMAGGLERKVLGNSFDPELQEKLSSSAQKAIDDYRAKKGEVKKLPSGKAQGSVERRFPGLTSRDQSKGLTVGGRSLKRT